MDSLEQFVMALGAEMQRAQQACDRLWPGTQVASLNVVLDVVRVDGELLGIYRRPGDEQAQ